MDNLIWSSRGVKQGDLLGPILFFLPIDSAIKPLLSPLNLWFLDDGTLTGLKDTVAADLQRLYPTLQKLDLDNNKHKCGIIHLGGRDPTRARDGGQEVHAEGSDTNRANSAAFPINGDSNPGPNTDSLLSLAPPPQTYPFWGPPSTLTAMTKPWPTSGRLPGPSVAGQPILVVTRPSS